MTFGKFMHQEPGALYPTYESGAMVLAEGLVYCHEHGCVHDNSTDPYGYGQQDCSRTEHRYVYWKARAGDYK